MKLKVLERAQHFVKAAHGLSTNSFRNALLRRVLGLLQGSSEARPAWSLSSSAQFDVVGNLHPKAALPPPRPEVFAERNGESFVDDATPRETSVTAPLPAAAATMTSKARAWGRGARVAGGALNLLKTFFYAVSWKRKKNGQPTTRAASDDPDVAIHLAQGNNRGCAKSVAREEASTGKRALGARLAPSGSDKTEHECRLAEATKLRPRLLRAPLSRESARKGLTTMVAQKLSYPLGATCFTEKECSAIQAKFLPTALSKVGISRSTPRGARSGPSPRAGAAAPELWPIQGSSKSKLLTGRLRKADVAGDNPQVELDCLQLQAGASRGALSREGARARPRVDKRWASRLWELNDRRGLAARREDEPWLLPQREHGQLIAEALTALPAAAAARLRGAQRCRLFSKLQRWLTSPAALART